MLKSNDLVHKLAFSLVVFLMLGCNSIKQNQKTEVIKPDQAIKDAKSLTRKQGTSVSESSQKPKLIKVSKTAPWLNNPLEASYAGNIDAKSALLSILNKQPVKFEVKGNGPLVKVDPKAQTFKQHLDTISEQANWAYSISDGVVTFSDWQIINYPVHFILGQNNINLTPTGMVSNDSGGSSDSSAQAGSQTNSLSINKNSLSELKEIMEKLILGSKSDESLSRKPSYSIIKSTNSILVSAPPNIQKQVENALMTINAIAGRTIHLAFDIYSVELSETYEKALDINILKNTGVKISSVVKPDVLSDGLKPYIFSINSEKSNYSSGIMLKALSESGKASLVNKGTLHLKNNQAGDISATSLIRMVEISPNADFLSNHPEYRESTIRVLPSIIDNKINLHMIISNSDIKPYLKSLKRERVTSSNSNFSEIQIQAEVSTIKLGEQFVIPTEVENGETLIIGGLTRKVITDNRQKNQMLPFFEGGRNKRQRRNETIIVLTAYLSD